MVKPEFSFSVAYLLYVVAVTLTSLLMIIVGGWVRERLQKGGLRFRFANKSRLRKKFTGFLLFILAIFLLGFLGERLQTSILGYLQKSTATNITGLVVALVIAWFLYDWLVWRKNRDD